MTDPFDRLEAALAGHYQLGQQLGAGGSAVVYLAEDLRHHRKVAVKVLRPDLAAAIGPARFLVEIEIAAGLSHPHILPLHDSGQAAGFLYYVMPYLEGESLRDRLNREKQLPLEEALKITGEVADALSYAHSLGVVHRDIKPENILFEAGHAVVTDFGIARAVAGGEQLTDTGIAVGTPTYMSPEQAAGDRQLDGRSDIYSLGCVLYEMLAGDPPYVGSSAHAILARKLVDPVPRLKTVREKVPETVEDLLTTALAKAPGDRFTTAEQFVEALGQASEPNAAPVAALGRQLRIWHVTLLALVTALLVVGGIWWVPERRGTGAPARGEGVIDPRSVAVLPFTNMSSDQETEPFVNGIHDDLLVRLSKIQNLKVISRTSVARYRDTPKGIREIAEELGVATVLEGGVQRAGDRVRVNAQLIGARTEAHLWAETYDRELTVESVFAIQMDLARKIASALRAQLTPDEADRMTRQPTEDFRAYELYQLGRYHSNRMTREELERAVEYFRYAIQQDSAYAAAYAGLADAYLIMESLGLMPVSVAVSIARDAAERAIELDPNLGEAHAALGHVLRHTLDGPGAQRELRRAIELSPSDAGSYSLYAMVLLLWGRHQEALEMGRRAVELDPLSPVPHTALAFALLANGDYQEAIEECQTTTELVPTFALGRLALAWAYAWMGSYDEAIQVFQEALNGVGQDAARGVGVRPTLAAIHAAAGETGKARALLDELQGQDERPLYLALAYAALGERDRAFEWLERAEWTVFASFTIRYDPLLNELRADPRFEEILSQVDRAWGF